MIYFFYETPVRFADKGHLKTFLRKWFRKKGIKVSGLNYIFCSDKYLLEINQQYLKHDYYTDIITFNMAAQNEPVAGEIYISVDRARENARLHHETLRREIHRLIFHGALHLAGYKDKTIAQKKEMRQAEEFLLNRYLKRST